MAIVVTFYNGLDISHLRGVPNFASSTFGTGGNCTSMFFFPAEMALEMAVLACLDICSSKYPPYIFGMPFPPSMSGMRPKTWLGVRTDNQRRAFIIIFDRRIKVDARGG